jgi:hypothetical protein
MDTASKFFDLYNAVQFMTADDRYAVEYIAPWFDRDDYVPSADVVAMVDALHSRYSKTTAF